MRIEVLCNASDLGALRDEWESLQPEFFASWTWCDTWLRHFPEERPWIVTARDGDGTLLGVAPLALRRTTVRGLPLTLLQFIGSSAPVEHFDFVVRPGREPAVLPAMLEAMRRAKFDVLELANILPHSPSLPFLPFERSQGHVAPVLHLPAAMDEVLAHMDKKKSERARYYLRRIERDFPGNWSVTTAEDVDTALEELIRVHQAQWQERGLPGAFADARLTTFYRDLAHRLHERGWLRMYRLSAGGRLVSANFAIVYRDRFLHFVNGTDYSVPVQSPGVVLHSKMIERSIAEGVREYDFMWGEEPYKYDWGAERRADVTLTWARSLRARTLHLARSVWRRLRAFVAPRPARGERVARSAG